MLSDISKNKKGGTVLLMTVLILASVLAVTLAVGDIVKSGLLMGRTQRYSTKAYFAAEAGAERILWEIRENNFDIGAECASGEHVCFDAESGGDIDVADNCDTTCPNFDKQTLSNNAWFEITYDYSAPTTTLTNFGFFSDVGRVVELKY